MKERRRKIYHLPALLAAFAACCWGALWHSQFLFRANWRAVLGLTVSQLKQVVLSYAPHLLTVAACLLFLYGVARLLGCARAGNAQLGGDSGAGRSPMLKLVTTC